jgi:hypothetical protein
VLVGGLDLEGIQEPVPIGAEFGKGIVDDLRPEVAVDDGFDATLVDGLGEGGVEFAVGGILVVAEDKEDLEVLARLQVQADVVGTYGRPTVGY